MMSERTELIKARRESEDSLVKTIIQLSSTLIVLISGFIIQVHIDLYKSILFLIISTSILLLTISLLSGLAEHIFSSKAYLEQQKLLEDYYSRKISSFEEPKANHWVRRCQIASFISFAIALIMLGTFALLEARGSSNDRSKISSASTAAAPITASTAAAPITGRHGAGRDKIGGAINATAAPKAKKGVSTQSR